MEFTDKELRWIVSILSQLNFKLIEEDSWNVGISVLKKLMKGIDELKDKEK